MNKKLKWFYRISSVIAIILILCTILVKVFIWTNALKEQNDDVQRRTVIRIYEHKDVYNIRYTTELKQRLFKQVEYLLTPAMMILFVIFTVRLVKAPDIFEEKK